MQHAFDTLPPALAARARAIVASREDGRNVHFINDRGQRDRFSFATMNCADAFRASLRAEGLVVLS